MEPDRQYEPVDDDTLSEGGSFKEEEQGLLTGSETPSNDQLPLYSSPSNSSPKRQTGYKVALLVITALACLATGAALAIAVLAYLKPTLFDAVTTPTTEGSIRPNVTLTEAPPSYSQQVADWSASETALRKYPGWGHHVPHASLFAMVSQLDNMLNGTIPPRIVQYRCGKGEVCGGVADRMLATMTAFTYAILTKRAFLMSWEWPTPIDLVFDSPFTDWSTPFAPTDTKHAHPLFSSPGFPTSPHVVNAVNAGPGTIEQIMTGMLNTDWNGKLWVSFISNRGALYRSFAGSPTAGPALRSMGLQPSTAYSCLLDYLVRPKLEATQFIAQYSALFALPQVFSVAIQIRTGDGSMWSPQWDAENTVPKFQHYFTCAAQLASSLAHPSQKTIYYLISDSEHLKASALAAFPDRVVLSGIGASHVLENMGAQEVFGTVNKLQDAVVESWIQGEVDAQIITNDSGFGKLQALRRGREGTTISLPKQGPAPDCGNPDSLTSFNKLSSACLVIVPRSGTEQMAKDLVKYD
ncbi:putative glycosyltransferase [Pseudohyphozyma bogoriensis]|nr:putative glycosyltransferase [Pseudohyphozyma bogoriensis]